MILMMFAFDELSVKRGPVECQTGAFECGSSPPLFKMRHVIIGSWPDRTWKAATSYQTPEDGARSRFRLLR